MRITCPNCGAQYEVPDEVIPAEGRDVQCSNCGDTWFQTQSGPRTTDADEDDDESFSGFDEPEDDEPENAFSRAEPDEPPLRRQPRELDPDVAGILREEAEHEARIRARDADPLESQGDLGLDAYPGDSSERRSDDAQDRMPRRRGDEAYESEPHSATRSGLLPDVDDINSSLRTGERTREAPRAEPEFPERSGGGFLRGFLLVLIVVAVLFFVYAQSESLAASFPGLEPALSSYAEWVNGLHSWINDQIGVYLPTE